MKILRRLPIGEDPRTILVGLETVVIKRFQLAVWVSIRDRVFPAILDTGHSHNFSISRTQLREWAGVPPESLREIGRTRLKEERLIQLAAEVFLHRNVPGSLDKGEGGIVLRMDQGISLVPEGSVRLPLLGLRAITRNNLKLVIDGKKRQASLASSRF